METIIINSSHQDTSTTNRFVYRFPQNVKFQKGDTVALQSISMYNSIFNVEATRSNNVIQLIWNADTTVTYTFTIPDGNYSIAQLNYFLQQQCVLNKLYATNATGDYIYFIELLTNSTRYACQINSYCLPTSAQATGLGYVKPAGATWDWPSSAKNVQFVVGKAGKPTGVLVDMRAWKKIIAALEDAEDVEIARKALAEIDAAGGDLEKAGYLPWGKVRTELEKMDAKK